VAFDETRRKALERWYDRDEVLNPLRTWLEKEKWYELEQYVRQDALLPLTFRDHLPDWMRDEEGEPLFSVEHLHPGQNPEGWGEAVDIGWSVVERRLDVERDDVVARIEKIQEDDWQRFLESVERRKRERGQA
jgi:hypothetical protein